MNILNSIIGYRSKTKWKMTVATIYYIAAIFNSFKSGWGFIPNIILYLTLPYVVMSLVEFKKPKKNKFIKLAVAIVLMFVGAAMLPEIKIESVKLNNDTVVMSKIGEELVLDYTIEPANATDNSVKFVSDNEKTVKIEDEKAIAVSDGEAHIYAVDENDKIISNKIKVTVKTNITEKEQTKAKGDDSEAKEKSSGQPEKKHADNAEEKTADKEVEQETTEESKKPEAEKNESSDASSGSAETSSPNVNSGYNQPDKEQDTIVYITATGNKYHNSGCRMLKKSKIEISLNDAIARGYGACGICH